MKKNAMLWKVLIAICLAVFIGSITGKDSKIFGIYFYQMFDIVGKLFLNALTLLMVPLIASSIISGIGQMGSSSSFGKLGVKTFILYFLTITLAVCTGMIITNLIRPGLFYQGIMERTTLASQSISQIPSALDIILQITQKIIPTNIIEAASQGNMLGVIFFSLLFGFALMKIGSPTKDNLIAFWKGMSKTLMSMTQFIMKAMPLGVFCLVAKVIAVQGIQSISALAYFFITVVCGLILFWVILLGAMKLIGINTSLYLKSIFPALVTAFSTSSSAATLPVTMDCVEKRAGVSNHICSFVIPLGTSMNMAGSALYEFVGVLFIAQAMGVSISFGHQIVIAVLSLVTSMGIGGLPSGSLVAIMIILNTMGLPGEAISLILPLDRLLDMCRTTTNVFSDASCAIIAAHSEGESILKESVLNMVD